MNPKDRDLFNKTAPLLETRRNDTEETYNFEKHLDSELMRNNKDWDDGLTT